MSRPITKPIDMAIANAIPTRLSVAARCRANSPEAISWAINGTTLQGGGNTSGSLPASASNDQNARSPVRDSAVTPAFGKLTANVYEKPLGQLSCLAHQFASAKPRHD